MRLLSLLRLYITLLLIFVTQKIVFMLFNIPLADGAPFAACIASLWHGLRLDSVTACYLLALPSLIVALSFLFKKFPLRKILLPYFIIASTTIAIIFIADTILYSFWGAKMDANDMIYATKPKDMLASLPLWSILLAIIVIAALIFHYTRRMLHAMPRTLDTPRSPLYTLTILPIAALLLVGMRGSITESTANPSYAYFSPHTFCNHAALNPTFNMLHSLFKIQNLNTEFNELPPDEVETLMAETFYSDPAITDTLLSNPRPNILLIIWESGGSGMVLNDSVGPNLQSLADEGVNFTNCYANNFRTDRGLISIIAGWQGLPTTSLMKRSDICRRLPSIARSMHDNGYYTSFTYGGDIGFTNMRLYLSESGFDSIFSDKSFPASFNQSAWGVPDHLVLTPSLIPQSRPFLSAVLTLSSHEPWQVPMRRLADDKENSFAYTDSCIGSLINTLRQQPLWDSLLVIILPDHGVAYRGMPSIASPQTAHIPIVMVGGAVRQHIVIDRLMNQSDLAATLLAQMHIDASQFLLSRNILSPQYSQHRQLAMHAYKNGCNLITPEKTSSFDCASRTAADTSAQHLTYALLQHIYHTTYTLER